MRASLPTRLLAAALAALIVAPIVPAAPARADDPISTTTEVSSSTPSPTYGDSITFTATVSPAAATGTVQFTVAGTPLGSPVTVVGGVAVSDEIASLPVGTHAVTAQFTSTDPTFLDSSGILAGGQVVGPATLSVQPAAVSLTYGSSIPSYSCAVDGFVLDETAATAAGYVAPTCSSDYTPTTPVESSPRPITCSGGSATNYTFAYEPANLTISRASQTIDFTSTPPSPATVGGTYTPTATATSGNPVAFTIDASTSARCSISDGVVDFTAAGACTINADQGGDGNWLAATQVQQTVTIGAAATTTALSSSANPVTYGTSITLTATVSPATATGTVTLKDGETTLGTCTLAAGTCAYPTPARALPAGTRSLTAVYGGDASYTGSTSPVVSQVVNPKPLTVAGVTAVSKTYDGTTTATLATGGASPVDVVSGDTVTLVTAGATGTFADKNVGTGKTVTVAGLTITGADAGNYTLTQPTATANITARSMTVSATGVNKEYDGTTAATVTLSSAQIIAGDAVDLSYGSALFSPDGNVGTSKTINVSGIAIGGADAGNYTLASTTATTSANITPRLLIATITASNRIYDGTVTASVSPTLDRVVSGDNVSVAVGSATFADKNAGTGKTVTATGLTLGGSDKNQYTLTNTTAETTASITPRTLTVTATGINKVYDGTTNAIVSLADNRLGGDGLTLGYASASFETAAVGTAKPVTVNGIAITGGADAGNYVLENTTAATTASITTATVAPTVTAIDKVYDGTTAATATCSLSGVVPADAGNVTCAGTATFANKAVGTGKTVTVSEITLAGTADGNYALSTTTAQTTASITPRPLTITATGIPKVYDGTTAASVTLSDNRVGGDTLTLGYTSASFSDKNAGTAKPVSVTGITVSGADAADYSYGTTAMATADITKRPLTVTATGQDKVYDGTTAATVSLGDNRVGGDALTTSYGSAAFASASAGIGKTVNVTGIEVTGADAGNYTWNGTTTTTATIMQKPVAPVVTAPDKVYDGTTAVPGAACSLDGLLDGDTVTCAGTAAFADKNVGANKTVTLTAIALSGAAAGNYAVSPTTATTTASITPRALTVTATGVNKVYDGTTVASVTLATNKLAADTVNATYTSAAFLDKTVGNGKFIAVSGISIGGADAANYALQNTTEETFANITRRTLTVTATASDKVYDGTVAATVSLADDRVPGDILTVSSTSATFATRHVGAGRTVTVSGLAIAGADAGNYQLAGASTTATASITPRPLTVTAVTSSKVYDGTTSSSSVPTITAGSLATGDTATWTQSFDTKNAGTGKTLTPAGAVADGNSGANYAVTFAPDTTGVITQKSLTVTGITAANKVYDGTTTATLTTGTATLVGRVTGDTTTTLVTTGATGTFADKNVGTGKTVAVAGLTLAGPDAANYALTQPTTTASIAKATLTVTADAKSRTYGAANPALTATLTGFVVGETLATSGVSGSPSCSTTATTSSGIGPYPITCAVGGLMADNYDFTFVGGTLTVQPAPLTVTAESKTRQYGKANPAETWTVTGFVLGETAATAAGFGGVPSCSTATPVTADVGAYPGAIVCTAGTLTATNYVVGALVPATLTVTPALAAPTVTSSANPAVASQDVTLTASVTWPTGTPTGTVTFYEGDTDLSGPVDLVDGVATFTTSWPEGGEEDVDHPITAVYSGDGANFGEAAATFHQFVGKSAVDVALTASAAKWEANVPLTFTADVHPVASGATIALAGTVTFEVDDVARATVNVVGGKAAFTTKLALGTRTVTASFTPATAVANVFKAGASAPLTANVVTNTVNASGVGVSSSSIYPVTDTWRDTVAIRGARNEPLAVSITIYSPTGSKVRTKSFTRAAGTYTYTWNGRNSSGTILAAGKYKVVQVLSDAWGARKTYTSYVTLSRQRMYWYTTTITVKPGPRNYQVRSTSNTDPTKDAILSTPSTTSSGALVMEQRLSDLAWLAVGYQFTLPAASTYTSLSFQVQGSWTGTTAPKIGLVPWSGGDWFKAMYSTTRARATMDSIATDWDPHTLTNLTGIRSGRYVRAVIDSFTGPSGYSAGPFRYSITGVRLVVKYGILR